LFPLTLLSLFNLVQKHQEGRRKSWKLGKRRTRKQRGYQEHRRGN